MVRGKRPRHRRTRGCGLRHRYGGGRSARRRRWGCRWVLEAGRAVTDLSEWLSDNVPEWLSTIWFAGSPYGPLKSEDRKAIEEITGKSWDQLKDEAIKSAPNFDDPDTVTGGIYKDVAQFITGFIPALRVTEMAKVGTGVAKVTGAAGRVIPRAGQVADNVGEVPGNSPKHRWRERLPTPPCLIPMKNAWQTWFKAIRPCKTRSLLIWRRSHDRPKPGSNARWKVLG